jgi:DnaJ domain/X-domain of DnaJ-containing
MLSLFPTHKPRHIADGLATLVRSVFVGIGLGLVSLISVPVAEFLRVQQEQQSPIDATMDQKSKSKSRWLGLLVGGVNGALFGSTFVVVGFVNGFYQAMRGMMHTPIAIQAIRKGMIWDTNREIWKLYYLTDELDELESFQPFQDETRSVKDLAYYDMLDVETNANVKEIKRAYHRKARAVHPDKNLGNQSAADEFRKLNTAYLTLSDTDKRIAYDRWGRSSEKGENGDSDEAPGIADFDPNVFFTILLNSKPVEKYIGNSTLASFTKQSMHLWRSGNGNSLEDVLRLFWNDNQSSLQNRRRRYLNIAIYLNEKVSAYVHGEVSMSEFRKRCRQEAIDIAREPFGVKYLSILGETLTVESDKYTITNTKVLGKLMSKLISVRNNLSAVKSSGVIMREIINTAKLVKENEITIVDEAALLQLLLPVMFEIGWMFYEVDIKHAIRSACLKLFADASVDSHSKRLQRAQTIRILAEEFLLVVQQEMERANHGDTFLSSDDLSARIAVAAEISVMKVRQRSSSWL